MPPKPAQAPIPGGPGWKDEKDGAGIGVGEKRAEGKAFWGTNWAGRGQWPRPKPEMPSNKDSSTKSTPAQSIRTQSPANAMAQSDKDDSIGFPPSAPERRDIADRYPLVLENPYVETEVDRIEEMLAMQSKLRDQCYIIKPTTLGPAKSDAEELFDRKLLLKRLMTQIHEMEEQHKKALADIAHMDDEVKEPFCKWYGEMADFRAVPSEEIKSMDLPMTNLMISQIQDLAVRVGEELVQLEGVVLEESFEANEKLLKMLADSRTE